MASKVTVKLEGDELVQRASRKIDLNAERVGAMISGDVVRSLSKGQPAVRDEKGRLRGLEPSKPGQPPRLLHGLLRNSVDHRVDRGRLDVEVVIGAYTPYAKALEFGNPKRKLGERPYLRPALDRNKEKAKTMLFRGVVS